MTKNDIELSRPYAEKLRGTMEMALKGSGKEGRSVDIQVGFVTNIIAQAVSEARSQAYEECAKIADEANDMARREFELDARDGPFTLQGSMATSKYISQAIRQHSQKGEDK